MVCQRCHLVGLRVVALVLNGSVAPTHKLKMKTSCFSAEILGNSGFIVLLRRFCPPEVSVGCSSSMTDANVPTLLPEHASRGAFLLGEQSSFDDLWLFQKYCVPLVTRYKSVPSDLYRVTTVSLQCPRTPIQDQRAKEDAMTRQSPGLSSWSSLSLPHFVFLGLW
jgi:hypothetical protein